MVYGVWCVVYGVWCMVCGVYIYLLVSITAYTSMPLFISVGVSLHVMGVAVARIIPLCMHMYMYLY